MWVDKSNLGLIIQIAVIHLTITIPLKLSENE